MDMGTPAGTSGPTCTRTRKNGTCVRVGSKTRTGHPRVRESVRYTRGISNVSDILLSNKVR
jgi:hypothetical protein